MKNNEQPPRAMKNLTQHTAALELAARIDQFRRQFPTDHARLLREYAELEPVGHRDAEIEEITQERDEAISDKRDLENDLDAMERERDAALSDLAEAERRIEELENTNEEEQ